MTFSPLALPAGKLSSQYSSRDGRKIDRLIYHHGATPDWQWMVNAMLSGTKEVSANYVCKPNGELVPIVDERFRAWTSASSAWDGRAITVECANLSTNGWTISDASHEALAQLAADAATRYGFKVTRAGASSTLLGHRELYLYYSASYATACPGAMDLDRISRRANEILAGKTTLPAATPAPIVTEGPDMLIVQNLASGGTYLLQKGFVRCFTNAFEAQIVADRIASSIPNFRIGKVEGNVFDLLAMSVAGAGHDDIPGQGYTWDREQQILDKLAA